MKLKLTPEGHVVVKDGKPVYVHAGGREEAFDAPSAMKILIGKHFAASPVMARLKIPTDVAAAFFGDSFRVEGGALVCVDKNGIQMYSGTRHGEIADFDEGLAKLVDLYPNKATILRAEGTHPAGQQAQGGQTVTRAAFDAMPQATRARFIQEGGRIGDIASSAAPTTSTKAQQGGKTVTRAQFDVMPTAERGAHFKAGGTVVD